jgi:hypothetical protein
MRQSQDQIQANREILQSIGKRDADQSEQRNSEHDDGEDIDSEFIISSTDEKSGSENPENNRYVQRTDRGRPPSCSLCMLVSGKKWSRCAP